MDQDLDAGDRIIDEAEIERIVGNAADAIPLQVVPGWEAAARRIGLAGSCSRLWASLERLERFGIVQFHATDVLAVRTMLPTLTERQLAKLPDDLAASYPYHSMSAVA